MDHSMLLIHNNAPIAAAAVLARESLCDDCLDLIRTCTDQMTRDAATAIAILARMDNHLERDDVTPEEKEEVQEMRHTIATALKRRYPNYANA